MRPFVRTSLAQTITCPKMTADRAYEIAAALDLIEAVIAESGGLDLVREEARHRITQRCPGRHRRRGPQFRLGRGHAGL